jgi:hypothetical protein
MPRSHTVQTSFLSGVLDPRATGRIDTDAYNQGLLRGINVEPVHLGGVRRRRGLKYLATMPNKLTRLEGGITITTPNGGTGANANDDNESTLLTSTTDVGTNNPFVLVHYDITTATPILFADVVGISSTGGSSTEFRIQYSNDNASWTTLGSAFALVDTTERSYRVAGPVTARYWRVAKIGGTDMGAVDMSLRNFSLWQDSGLVSAGRSLSFEVSTEERYSVVLTDRSLTVFSDGTVVGRQPSPYVSADLADIDSASNAETMALVHEDYNIRFLIRESATNFQLFTPEFTNIPEVDYADSSSPSPTSDVQILTFDAAWAEGGLFQITLEGSRTASISYAGDNATTAANIQREVQKLGSVKSFTGVTCARTAADEFTITLADSAADAYDQMTAAGVGITSPITCNHSVTGVARREPLWSATRGYPRTVEFFEGRLYFGGTRSRQQSLVSSQVNNILEVSTGDGQDDDGVFVTLNGRQLNAIQGLFAGRSLQIFTSGGEFRYAKEQGVPVTPADVPVNQTQYGAAKIRPVTIDGATIYIQRNRKSVRDFRFDINENAYNSLGISALCPHLIYDVQDLAAYNGSAIDEISLVLVVNGTNASEDDDAFPGGTLAVFNSRKEQNIQAWCIWVTDGKFKSVNTILQEMYFLVERSIDGTSYLFFEKGDPDRYTDSASTYSGAATTTITGLDHLNGEECRVRADGFVLENNTPAAGSITVERSSEEVEVGLNFDPDVTPMPLQTLTPVGSNFLRKRRVVGIRVRVRKTLGLLCNERVLPDRFFDQVNFDEPATPFSGVHKIEETTNWDETQDKLVSFTQTDPLPMEILAIDVQLESND